jgi:hypothetical protein
VYDLRERVHPTWSDADLLPVEETDLALARAAVRALGIARTSWVADYFRMPKAAAARATAQLLASGGLLAVEVEGWPDAGLAPVENEERVRAAADARGTPGHTTLLSPFDPLVWDRGRARAVFGFDYRLESYTPAAKREFGYFVLPILRRGRIVGRLDAKAHRRAGVMEVHGLWLEPDIQPSEALASDIARALMDFSAWHSTPAVRLRRTRPPGFLRPLRTALEQAEAECRRG